jgi:hypothetical protein
MKYLAHLIGCLTSIVAWSVREAEFLRPNFTACSSKILNLLKFSSRGILVDLLRPLVETVDLKKLLAVVSPLTWMTALVFGGVLTL